MAMFSWLFSITLKEYQEANKTYKELSSNQINIQLPQTSTLYDQNGQSYTDIFQNENRIYKDIREIPSFLIDLVITNEDRNFYEHKGIDLIAIIRAALINANSSDIQQGGSTITQQLAKNLFLTNEKTFERKWNEILYTLALEKKYTKEKILELYLNSIYFQNGNYGVEAASQFYFQKSIDHLTKGELSFLAAIPNNPTLYNPLTNFTRTKERQEVLLKGLLKNKKISKDEFNQILKEPITLNIKQRLYQYPDYTDYVLEELRELVRSQPENQHLTDDQIEEKTNELLASGVKIHTSLDPTLQEKAVKTIKDYLSPIPIEGAMAIIDHDQQAIVSLVGGKHYKPQNFNRAYQAYRQPASAIKPLIVYAPYLERFPEKYQSMVNANNICIQSYCPKNYGGYEYGNVSLREAFIHSYNTPAIRLFYQLGAEEAFSDLAPFQFKKVVEADYRLPAAIGGFTYGLSPLEITKAYTVFSTSGVYSEPKAIQKVTDRNGNVLLQWEQTPVQVWNQSTVSMVRSLLQATVLEGTGRIAYFPTNIIGGKTGTSNDVKDLWFVGYTNNYTAGIWIGYDEPKSMEHLSNEIHMNIWKDVLK